MNTAVIEKEDYGVCSIFNRAGDITIAWDEENKEQVLALIRKKMEEGYTFFTTKKIMFNRLKRKIKITEKNIDLTEEVIITDEQFERMLVDLDDKEVAALIKKDKIRLAKRAGRSEIETIEKVKKAEDLLNKNSVGIRPIVGG